MSIEGYVEYKKREFCNDVMCPVQLELNACKPGSEEYEKNKTNLREGLQTYHMGVSPLADRQRIFNSQAQKVKGMTWTGG